ncbi:probable cytochrome P450 6a14 [Periplaneta americana]|uniref:probable cytochrome P450 6a14 n=1 Tax=Periplaneta americana TaxID=6978 RepID=UPI0037E8489E
MEILSWILLCATLVVGLLGALYLYFSVKYKYWKKKGVPHLQPTFPAGNVSDLMYSRKSIGEVYADFYRKFEGQRFAGIYQFHSPTLLALDPELIKNVLVKDFDHFHDRGFPFDEKIEPLGANLFQLNGAKWKSLRNKLSPSLTSGKMKMMIQIMIDCGKELGKYLEDPARKQDIVEVKDILARFTTDIIASAAFGIQCNCLKNPNAEFREWGRKLIEPSFNQKFRDLLYLTVPDLAISLGIPNIPSHLANFFIKVVEETVGHREKNNIKRNDFMQLLIQLLNNNNIDEEEKQVTKGGDVAITMTEVAAQSVIFFVAGFETSATTLSFCLYELALNPDIQDRLREEIDTVLEKYDGNITYEGIQEMSYLDNVLSETLRKHPPAPFVFRECTKEYKIPDSEVVVDTGSKVLVPIMGLHYDPKYFPDPTRFDPDRFTEEVKKTRHHYSYLPFGEGPRICIGMRFALLQTKVGLVTLLSKYQFNVCEKTAVPFVYDPKSLILFMKGGTWLQVKNRSN